MTKKKNVCNIQTKKSEHIIFPGNPKQICEQSQQLRSHKSWVQEHLLNQAGKRMQQVSQISGTTATTAHIILPQIHPPFLSLTSP